MAKYLAIWQVDETKLPANPKERVAMLEASIAMVEKDLKKGISKDWGMFLGEGRGYGIAEGTEVDVAAMLQQYEPYVKFELHPVLSARMVRQVIKSMPK